MKSLRSLLSTPGNRADMLDKALSYGADAIIVDLEDSVPAEEKDDARAATRAFVERRGGEIPVYVRVNHARHELLPGDLDAIAVDGLVGIQLPKAASPDDVRSVAARLDELEAERGLPPGGIEMIVSLESALGVLHAYEILGASPRVGSTMPGTAENGDLQSDLGCEYTADEIAFLYTRSHVLLCARAVGIENPIDGVYGNVRDSEGFEATARQARILGYRGKKVIHPRQIEIANRVFAPTSEELDFHERVLEALGEAAKRGSAATVVDGKMVDTAMVETARRVLAWGEEIGSR
jgi:citrate lyase subunit beta/citryl-CoA lyase